MLKIALRSDKLGTVLDLGSDHTDIFLDINSERVKVFEQHTLHFKTTICIETLITLV